MYRRHTARPDPRREYSRWLSRLAIDTTDLDRERIPAARRRVDHVRAHASPVR
jgi:hypothetical protein